jgi:hypothetical protein
MSSPNAVAMRSSTTMLGLRFPSSTPLRYPRRRRWLGYSGLAGADEDRTLSRLRGLRSDLIDPAIDAHHGRIVKRTGDGIIIDFRSVVDAVRVVFIGTTTKSPV